MGWDGRICKEIAAEGLGGDGGVAEEIIIPLIITI